MLNRTMLAEQVERVDSLRQAVVDAEQQLAITMDDYAEGRVQAENELVDDISPGIGGAFLVDQEIAEFTEAAMRVAGRPKEEAAAAGGKLATVFDASHGTDPAVAYFYGTPEARGDFIVVQRSAAQGEHEEPVHLVMNAERREGSTGNRYSVAAFPGGGPLGVFGHDYTLLNTAGTKTVHWTIGAGGKDNKIDFATVKVIDDPELVAQEGWRSDLEGGRVYIGDAVEAALTREDGYRYGMTYDPEVIALLALLRQSHGQLPNVPFADRQGQMRTHQEQTLSLIAHYAGSLLNDESGKLLAKGLPVQLHVTALEHQGINRHAIGRALLKGIAHGGGVLRDEDVTRINERIDDDMKPKISARFIDRLFRYKARELQEKIEALGSDSGLDFFPEALLSIAASEPELFKRSVLFSPHRGDLGLSPERHKANTAVHDYFRHTSRFRAAI